MPTSPGRGGGRGRGFRGGRGRGGGRGGAAQRELQVRPRGVVHGARWWGWRPRRWCRACPAPARRWRGCRRCWSPAGRPACCPCCPRCAHSRRATLPSALQVKVDARDRGVDVVYAVHGRLDGGYADPRRAHLGPGRAWRSAWAWARRRRARGRSREAAASPRWPRRSRPGPRSAGTAPRRLRHRAEVSGDVGAVVVQLAQAALQPGHAVVGIGRAGA